MFSLLAVLSLAACDFGGPPSSWETITAIVETDAVHRAGDAADDPAIWRNEADPAASLIIATDKRAGLYVYDLSGRQVSFLGAGQTNNVDLRELRPVAGKNTILVAASETANNRVVFFTLDPKTGELASLPTNLHSELSAIYGLCMYQPEPDSIEVLENRYGILARRANGLA